MNETITMGSLEAIVAVSTVIITSVCGVMIAKLNRNSIKTQEAVDLARPTGNGFAETVKHSLATQEATLNAVRSSQESHNGTMINLMATQSATIGDLTGRVGRLESYHPQGNNNNNNKEGE
jgi:hypothetical protein